VRTTVRVVLVLLLLLGVVWIGQGVGLIKGSFMTGEIVWSIIGAIVSAAAAIGLWLTTRPRES
jgi:hypothetical protein